MDAAGPWAGERLLQIQFNHADIDESLPMFLRSKYSVFGLLGFLAALVTDTATAQVIEGEVSVQRFDPAVGSGNFLTTRTAAVAGHLNWTAGFIANYGFEPFTVKRCATDCVDEEPLEIKVVENMVTADFMGSLNLIDRIQVGLRIPVTWVKGHGIQETAEDGVTAADGGLSAVGMGDLQLEVKGRIYGKPEDLLRLGAYLYGTAPLGTVTAEGSYIGNSSPTVGLSLIADGDLGPFSYGVNLGGMYRKAAKIGEGSTVGSEAKWSVGLGYRIAPVIEVVVDGFGATNFSTTDLGATSVEIDLGGRLFPIGNQLSVLLGGGVGVFKGVGVPTARAFLGVGYDSRVADSDGDGFADDKDGCADAAEDMDNVQDGDGCPDLDNDEDGLPDETDKCRDSAEDVDDFEDNDGCPEPDNDKDAIKDVSDRCPKEAETKNGFEDEDGCPDVADTDADGVPDATDKCVQEAEDTDGFEDLDGCPELDNDGDGVPDAQDECIDEPEDGKGKKPAEKTDGCPVGGATMDMD